MLLWADDFGRYGSTEAFMLDGLYAQVDQLGVNMSWDLSTVNPRTGSHAFRLTSGAGNGGGVLWRRIFGSQQTEVGVAAGFYFSALPVVEAALPNSPDFQTMMVLFEFRNTANAEQITFILGTDGSIDCTTGALFSAPISAATVRGTSLGRSDPCVTADAWNHIAVYAVGGASSDGSVEVRVNGVTVLNLAGVTTCHTGVVDYSQVVCGNTHGVIKALASGVTLDVADLYAWNSQGTQNTTFPGDVKAYLTFPNADSGVSGDADWTPSAGVTRYNNIDEAPPNDDADYIYASNVGERVGFQMTDLPTNASEVRALIGWFRGKKTDAGICTIQIGVRSAGVIGWSGDIPITTTQTYWEWPFETDPATGAPWTPAAVNAAQLLYKRVA